MSIVLNKLPIETERLIIRPFENSDLSPFLEFMLDEESTRHLAFSNDQKTKEGAKLLFEYVINSYKSDNPIESLAVCTKNDNRYVGSVGFSPYEDKVYECYYSINKEFWRQGYAKEAMIGLLKIVEPGQIIRAHCSPENLPSHKTAEAIGMRSIGEIEHIHSNLKGVGFELTT